MTAMLDGLIEIERHAERARAMAMVGSLAREIPEGDSAAYFAQLEALCSQVLELVDGLQFDCRAGAEVVRVAVPPPATQPRHGRAEKMRARRSA